MAKERIIHELGEDALLLPEMVQRALAANDRVKYLLALLQSARVAADGGAPADLRDERIAAGVQDPALDRVIAASARSMKGRYEIPQAQRVLSQALEEIETMLAPLQVAKIADADTLQGRLDVLNASLRLEGDSVSAAQMGAATGAERRQDSLHLIVLDAHRALSSLAEQLAGETVDGARVHGLAPGDEDLVRAFMRGIRDTERLRFGHPGLGTIATRRDATLVLQNDLGMTDAHVVVIRVQADTVTVTSTDIHLERLLFFERLLESRGFSWDDTRSRAAQEIEGGMFHLATGRAQLQDTAELEGFLRDLGSQLVFMIDWNRARKRLRALVGKNAAVDLLSWAAEHRYGHRAFLIAGAEGLVYDALQLAGQAVSAGGAPLSAVLGQAAAIAYLRSVLRICSDGMLAGRSVALIQDEVRAELVGYLHTARQELLDLISRHGELVVEIAEATRDELALALDGGRAQGADAAGQARAWEHEADEIVTRLRDYLARTDGAIGLLDVIEAADDIADSLEDAAFHLTLLRPPGPAREIAQPLRGMCELLVAAARAHLRTVMFAADVQRGGSREDMQAFLEAVHAVVSLERETDDAERAVHVALAASAPPAGELFVLAAVTGAFEQAADSLMHAALLMRDQVLGRAMRADAPLRRQETAGGARAEGLTASDEMYVLGASSGSVPGPEVIGAKAHGLARIARAGLRVPEAAVLTTAVSRRAATDRSPPQIVELTEQALRCLEESTGLCLGDPRRPLVLSVRSGAPVSMPGMLETVLDVGLCARTVEGLAARTGNPRLAWDSYRRLIESFASVVAAVSSQPFQQAVGQQVAAAGVALPAELEVLALKELVVGHLQRFEELAGRPFPEDPHDQLEQAVMAVLRSWRAPKARAYRRMASVPDDIGTAVILQRMVFGNAGRRSGSGVGFTRDPAVGSHGLYVDFLADAQGEDIVAGRQQLHAVQERDGMGPALYQELQSTCEVLERELRDAQEFEFTVQDGELFLLQSRTAKRTPWAALQIAVDQVAEGLISADTALTRLAGLDLRSLCRRRVSDAGEQVALARATPASVGVATGPIALDAPAATRMSSEGRAPVIVLRETSTDDIAAMVSSAGILTAAGGRTSHAAVVARELGKPCLVGCAELRIDMDERAITVGAQTLAEGEEVTLDCESGLIYQGAAEVIEERPTAAVAQVERWRAGRTVDASAPAARG